MIDMQGVFTHTDYADTVERFNEYKLCEESECQHGIFKALHKDVANNKCPVCEVELDMKGVVGSSGTIDHFRPQSSKMYPLLKCEPKNYILMCNLCNTRYKESKFPLVDESKRAVTATTIEETYNEQPLLFNPAEENPLDFFELAFKQTEVGHVLELQIKASIPENSYEYQRSEKMINLFGLGYVHKDIHPDEETKKLRVDILTAHYETFIEFAQLVHDGNETQQALFMRDENRIIELKKYGFFQFLSKKQFHIY